MARIRSIKPEFFSSEQVAECSPSARLLFVGLWCFSDDGGIHPASTKQAKMEIFPGDSLSDEQVKALVQELIAAGLLRSFVADGRTYWYVTGWRHQRIDRPTYKHPRPPALDEPAASDRRAVGEASPPEGSGRDTDTDTDGRAPANGHERSRKQTAAVEIPAALQGAAFVGAWDRWLAYRRERRLTLSATTLHAQLVELAGAGPAAAVAAVETAIRSGWSGVFPRRENGRAPAQSRLGRGQKAPTETIAP